MRLSHVLPAAGAGVLLLVAAACGDSNGDDHIPLTGNRPTTTTTEALPEAEAEEPDEGDDAGAVTEAEEDPATDGQEPAEEAEAPTELSDDAEAGS